MSDLRDSKGRFLNGRDGSSEPIESKIKKMYSLQESWKNRPDYIGDIKDTYPRIYNVWRGIMFTDKGKKQGISDEWKSFRNFYNDVVSTYEGGKLFRRLDTTKPYSKDNFMWVTHDEAKLLISNLIIIEYNNKNLSLKEWAEELNIPFNSIKNRYNRRNKYNFTVEEVLFGRKKKRGSKIVKDAEHNLRSKVSKMISSYKIKDKKNGTSICDIDIDWMIENIINKPCVYCGDTHKIGCDRIDNTKGHTKDNVQPCCYECNVARGNNFSVEEMKIIGKAIKEVKDSRH